MLGRGSSCLHITDLFACLEKEHWPLVVSDEYSSALERGALVLLVKGLHRMESEKRSPVRSLEFNALLDIPVMVLRF